jgi:hypothetical protein
MSDADLVWEPCAAPPLSAEAVREWEEEFDLQLPRELARALAQQNGGRIRGMELIIEQLDGFTTLDDEQWDHVVAEGPLRELSRGRLLCIGEAAGCGVVLDYATGGEPRVLLLHHNLGGELRDHGIGSFEELVGLMRSPPDSDPADATKARELRAKKK